MEWDLFFGLIKGIVAIGFVLQIVPGLIYLERKIAGWVQGRVGPNRVNLYIPVSIGGRRMPLGGLKLIPGSLQPLADAIKLAFKEEIVPAEADRVLYYLGPILAFVPVGIALAFIPFGIKGTVGDWQVDLRVASADVGVLALLAVVSLSVYGIAAGGWGSGSKYPLMGAVRASAQMISYEVAMGLTLLSIIATCGAVDLQDAVLYQAETWYGWGWGVVLQPLAALIFLVAMFAENNRLPFDLPECEPELVGGFHTEYTGLKFALFFLGEYAAMILMSGLFVTFFLGGWSVPMLPFWGYAQAYFEGAAMPSGIGAAYLVDPHGTTILNAALSCGAFVTKILVVLLFQLWIRWTLPRFRYDQLMHLGWKVMVPLALLNLVVTAVGVTFSAAESPFVLLVGTWVMTALAFSLFPGLSAAVPRAPRIPTGAMR